MLRSRLLCSEKRLKLAESCLQALELPPQHR